MTSQRSTQAALLSATIKGFELIFLSYTTADDVIQGSVRLIESLSECRGNKCHK